MQHHVALLALGLEVGQTLPVDKVLGAGDATGGCGSREVARLVVVMTLHAEEAVDPAILVAGEAHVVDVHAGDVILGHGDGMVPEAEAVNPVGAFGHGEE